MANTIRTLAIGGALALVLGIIFFGALGTSTTAQRNSLSSNTVQQATGEYQEVTVQFINYEYQLTPSTLIKGIPVRMTVDLNSVYGCMRDIVIPSENIRKFVRPTDSIITFTPQQTGTFAIRCSMNMGRGTFTVVEADGTTSSYVEEQPLDVFFPSPASSCSTNAGGSCGMTTSSCGTNAFGCGAR